MAYVGGLLIKQRHGDQAEDEDGVDEGRSGAVLAEKDLVC
jgi:hypothetical protein